MRANLPVTDLRDGPNGQRVSQLLFGEPFTVEKTRGPHSFGRTECGYRGWLPSAALARARSTSHWLNALGSFVYAKPDMKSDLRLRLPFGARVRVLGTDGPFARLPEGYIFAAHLARQPVADYVAVAERFVGMPYLWGGRSELGVDCSGLVQLALRASGRPAPRDSGPQSVQLGTPLPDGAPLRRGDLIFWQGHVGVMQNQDTLLHATAFSMQVTCEPLAQATARIKARGDGDITARRRLRPPELFEPS